MHRSLWEEMHMMSRPAGSTVGLAGGTIHLSSGVFYPQPRMLPFDVSHLLLTGPSVIRKGSSSHRTKPSRAQWSLQNNHGRCLVGIPLSPVSVRS